MCICSNFFHMISRGITEVCFITGFLICHSFLDFLYIGFLAPPYGVIIYPGRTLPAKYPLPVTCDTLHTTQCIFWLHCEIGKLKWFAR